MTGVNVIEDKNAYDDAISVKDALVVVHILSDSDRRNGSLDAGLQRMSNDYSSTKFFKLNKDKLPEVAKELDIFGTPMIMFFKDGSKIDDLLGENLDEIRSAIEHHRGSTKW